MREQYLAPVFFALAFVAGCALGGCAIDRQAKDDDPYHLEHTDDTGAHGEVGVSYGHSTN
jgi:hypothetical protein